MDWNLNTSSEWDWENLAMYGSREIEIPKNLQFSSHGNGVVDINGGEFSFSTSIDSSSKEKVETFGAIDDQGFPKEQEFSWVVEKNGNFEASVLSGEAMIGLKLGRQTFSPDLSGCSSNHKRSRASYHSSQPSRCQVEGCNLDLASAKDYHRRHRICANHSKSPKVIVAGMERRFCQQCSRFHNLSEFDEQKRSCRRRLSAHNARRRRPQSDDIQFTSTGMPSSICDRRPHMSFLVSQVSTPVSNHALCDFKVAQEEASSLSLANGGGMGVMSNAALHMDSDRASFHNVTRRNVNHNGVEATSNTLYTSEVRHAFSLLSTTSWPLNNNGPEQPSAFDQFVHGNTISLAQPGLPLELQTTCTTQLSHEFECFYSS